MYLKVWWIQYFRHEYSSILCKRSYRPKWNIYNHFLDNSKKCLSVGNSGILSVVVVVVVCVIAPACTSLCRGRKYLIKVRYIILVDLNSARFLIFETVVLGRTATLPYVKKNTKICVWWHIL